MRCSFQEMYWPSGDVASVSREAMGGLSLEESIAAFFAQEPKWKHAAVSMKHTIGFGSIFIIVALCLDRILLAPFFEYILYQGLGYIEIV